MQTSQEHIRQKKADKAMLRLIRGFGVIIFLYFTAHYIAYLLMH